MPPALPYVATAFFATAAVVLSLMGPIADVYGRRRLALASLAVFVLAAVLTTGYAVAFAVTLAVPS